ncbi:MAG: hypothetical protein ACOYKE_00555 [Ferruginibacter sp.]
MLYESLTAQATSPETVKAQLELLVSQYPYFIPARYFLLRNTPESNAKYASLAAQTAAHFSNGYRLQHRLMSDSMEQTSIESVLDTPSNDHLIYPITNKEDQPSLTENKEADLEIESAQFSAETTDEAIPETNAVIIEAEEPKADNLEEVIQALDSELLSNEENEEIDTEENESLDSNFSDQPLPGAAHRFNEINTANVNQPLFEPLHTTDYFASVGIKISDQVLASDRLGIQLRSFTDWLKTMKKLHGDQIPVQNTVKAEENVQHLAEISNTKEEIVTEAMAEVLVQQGKKNKAIEVYQKLSLLNPTKIAYFAAKIDQLRADDIA